VNPGDTIDIEGRWRLSRAYGQLYHNRDAFLLTSVGSVLHVLNSVIFAVPKRNSWCVCWYGRGLEYMILYGILNH